MKTRARIDSFTDGPLRWVNSSQIKARKPVPLQCKHQPVPMAGRWVGFQAHEGYGMVSEVKKAMEIVAYELFRYVAVIPVPKFSAIMLANCHAADIAGYAQFG